MLQHTVKVGMELQRASFPASQLFLNNVVCSGKALCSNGRGSSQQSDSKFCHSLQLTSTVCVEMAELLNPSENTHEQPEVFECVNTEVDNPRHKSIKTKFCFRDRTPEIKFGC